VLQLEHLKLLRQNHSGDIAEGVAAEGVEAMWKDLLER
jgi:hypothetical protein